MQNKRDDFDVIYINARENNHGTSAEMESVYEPPHGKPNNVVSE